MVQAYEKCRLEKSLITKFEKRVTPQNTRAQPLGSKMKINKFLISCILIGATLLTTQTSHSQNKSAKSTDEMAASIRLELKEEVRKELEAENKLRHDLQMKENKDPFEGLPQKGVLASFGSGVGSQMMGGFGGLSTHEADGTPLSASVTKNGNSWVVTVNNSSEKSVSAEVYLVQFNKEGRKLKKNNMTFSLSPQGKYSRTTTAMVGASQVIVELNGWKTK